jgi:hypothetical protein
LLFRLQIKIIGARLFLIWYQILNKNKTCIEELMFQKLVHSFEIFHTQYSSAELMNAEAQKVFNTNSNDDGYYLKKK